ncbi:MAG: GNAT family N-acetyltransferase [Flavobacterium sp.]|nr:GNAT family N-acetyltransferase [Flavobacterium sp.]
MLALNFTPFPILETERLLLRRLENSDLKNVYALRSNPKTMQYIPRPLATTENEALEHIKMINEKIENNEGINWAVTLKENPDCIGIMGLYRIQKENYRSEIGYMILPEYNGKGIVTEAVARIVQYGFEILNLHSIEGVIDPDNIASARVLEKNGFIKEAHFKENEYYAGKFLDTVVYSLLNKV